MLNTKYFLAFVGFVVGDGLDIAWCVVYSCAVAYADPVNGPTIEGMLNDSGIVVMSLISSAWISLLGFFAQKALTRGVLAFRSHSEQ